MLEMVVFTTDATEDKLFLRLVGRGRHADIPCYQLVETHVCDEGTVVFCRLDCSPAQPYKVGVAGNRLMTTTTFQHHLQTWLREWNMAFTHEKKQVHSPEEARALFADMRKESEEGRQLALEKIRAGLQRQRDAEEAEIVENM